MLKGIKVRLYLNKEQTQMFEQNFGNCRLVYNLGLDLKQYAYVSRKTNISKYELINQLPDLKEGFPFLKNTKAEVLQNVFDQLELAYEKFFKGGGYPKFKKKGDNQSFTQKQTLKIKGNRIIFLKQGLKFRCSKRDLQDLQNLKLKRITYSKQNNKYFASVLVEDNVIREYPKTNSQIGIDVGLKEFLVDSNGNKVENPRFLRKKLKRLRFLQRQLSKKKRGSNNRNKARKRVSDLHEKIRNQRNNFLHSLSSKLTNENQVIIAESLRVRNMVKNHKLALSISDASWSQFLMQLEYKSGWKNRVFHQIDTFCPSSKTCSECGWIKRDLTLKDREFCCEECGVLIDRDLNAALNIKSVGLKALGMNQPEIKLVEKNSLEFSKKQESELLFY